MKAAKDKAHKGDPEAKELKALPSAKPLDKSVTQNESKGDITKADSATGSTTKAPAASSGLAARSS